MQIFKSSLSLKLFVIGFLIAILMIPIGMIAFLANERESRQLEDSSLLVGSLGLLAILSLVMLVSRKIDWYSVAQE